MHGTRTIDPNKNFDQTAAIVKKVRISACASVVVMLSLCLSLCQSLCLSLSLSVCLSLSVSLSVSLSLCIFLSLYHLERGREDALRWQHRLVPLERRFWIGLGFSV